MVTEWTTSDEQSPKSPPGKQRPDGFEKSLEGHLQPPIYGSVVAIIAATPMSEPDDYATPFQTLTPTLCSGLLITHQSADRD